MIRIARLRTITRATRKSVHRLAFIRLGFAGGVPARQSASTPEKTTRVATRAYASTANSGGDSEIRNFAGAPRYVGQDRPISPHVTIYRFALPAITSIMHRVTGTSLALGMIAVAIPTIFNPGFPLAVIGFIKAHAFLHVLTKLLVSWPLVYHTINGLRHMYWDFSSRGLESVEQADKSSRFVLYSSTILAILLSFIAF